MQKQEISDAWRMAIALTVAFFLHALALVVFGFFLRSRFSVAGGIGKRPSDMAATLFQKRAAENAPRPAVAAPAVGSPVVQNAGIPSNDSVSAEGEPRKENVEVDQFSSGGGFHTTDQLTVKPKALADVQLDVPAIAVERMVMNLWIEDTGEVRMVSVESPDQPEPTASLIVEAFRKLRFRPGEINGRKVRTVMKIEASYGDAYPPEQ